MTDLTGVTDLVEDSSSFKRPGAIVGMDGDQLLARYMRWLPLLWFLGLNIVAMMALVVRLAWTRWPTERALNLVFLAWTAVAAAQGVSAIQNWLVAGLPLSSLPKLLISYTTLGWLFIGVGLAVGQASRMASPVAIRGIMVLSLYIALFGALGYLIAFATHSPYFYISTPVHYLVGGRKGADFYTLAVFYTSEAGGGLPRLILFFPWPTCLSLAGICIILIADCERDIRWRMIGSAGGLIATVFSFSRAGFVALPLAYGASLLLRARPAVQAAGLLAVCCVGLAMLVANIGPAEIIDGLLGTLRESRAGSSEARDLIYEESWRAFLRAPMLGWGWVGESIISQEELPIGSHSTLYGTLYTGGLVTFACLVFATILTFGLALRRALVERRVTGAAAIGILVALVIFAYGESMYSLALPIMFAFLFLGGALAPAAQRGAVA